MALALPAVVVALVVLVIRLASGRRARIQPVIPSSPELRAVAQTTRRALLVGVAVGILVAVVVAHQGGLGRGLLLAAPLFALCVLAGVLVGELQLGTPRGPVRQAVLEVRRIRDYVPRALGPAVLAAGALLAVLLVLTAAAGSPDDMGRAGRSLVRRCSAVLTAGAGPWPGSYYAVPSAVVVLCGLLAAGAVLSRVVRRPRLSDDLPVDEALRRSAAGSVTAAVGLLITIPLAGVSLVAAGALVGVSCHPVWWSVAAIGLGALAVASVTLAAVCVSTLTTRGWRDARVAVPADR